MMLNVNDSVLVKLTDHGRKVHRENHEMLWAGSAKAPEYRPPKEDADGRSRWQLWHLMQEFGPHMGLGMRVPFETLMEVEA